MVVRAGEGIVATGSGRGRIRLVERDAELALLDRSFADTAAHRGRVVLVSGGVGTGKTELLRSFVDRIAPGAAVVLSDAGVAGGPAWGVLRRLRRDLGPSVFAADTDGPGAALRFCHEVEELARLVPVVLVVDDAQDCDEPSLAALVALAGRLRSARILLVLAEGTAGRAVPQAHRVELVRQPFLDRIRLSALSRSGVQELLAGLSDHAHRFAAETHAMTGGNPLLVRAIVEDHQNAGQPGGSAPVAGDGFAHAVRTCVRRCAAGAADVVTAAAVLDSAATEGRIAQLLDVEVHRVARLARDLRSEGLLSGDRVRHPVLAGAVLEGVEPAEAADLHLAAAQLLHADGVPAAEVAGHLQAAGRLPGPWAMELVRSAADQALDDDDVTAANRLLEFALDACDGGSDRAAVRLALLRVQARRDPEAALRHVGPLCAAGRDGHLDGEQIDAVVRFALWHGRIREAGPLIERMSTGAERGGTAHWMRLSYPELAAHRGPGGAPPLGRLAQSAAALAGAWRGADPGGQPMLEDAAKAAELVLQSTPLMDSTVDALDMALQTLVCCDELDVAATWCAGLLAEAQSRGASAWSARFVAVHAELSLRRGDLLVASEQAELALALIGAPGWGIGVGRPLGTAVLAAVARGRTAEAQRHLALPVPDAMLQTPYGVTYLHARGRFYLATDRARAALADLTHCGQLMTRWRLDAPELVPWRLAAAECHLRLDAPDRARELVQEQLTRLGRRRGRQLGAAQRVLAATLGLRARLRLLKESVEVLHACGDQLELARALHDLGRTHHALGEFGKAEMVLGRARQVGAPSRGGVGRKRAGRNRAPAVTRDDALAVLTMSELRVASLASLGYTNREISAKLYVTVSTVEQHLTKAFRKLKVKRRTDLPTDLELDPSRSA